MSRRSVSAACKQCLSTCAVCRETSKGSGADQIELFFFFFFWELSIQQRKTTEDTWCAGSERSGEEKKQQRIPEKAQVLPTSDLMLIPLFYLLGLVLLTRCPAQQLPSPVVRKKIKEKRKTEKTPPVWRPEELSALLFPFISLARIYILIESWCLSQTILAE